MEAAIQPEVRRVAVKCSAQSAKTQTMMNLGCWAIGEEPGPAMWVMAAKDESRDFMRDRILPTFRKCKPVWAKLAALEGMTFVFDSMPFYFTGAHSKSKLQSKPIRWLFLDEVRNYPPGSLQLALKRTRAFWNAKEFIISTPDQKGDDVDVEFIEGTQETWHICCPKCAKWQPLVFGMLKWDANEETRPAAEYSFDRLALTIRLQCGGCEHFWTDTPHERRELAMKGKFIALQPNAPKHRRSFHWNALLPTWISWRSLVEEYLGAVRCARADPPDLEPFKSFYNESLGESWEDSLGVVDDYDFLEQRKGSYDFGEVWAEEKARFMAADKQAEGGEHYWYVVRAYGPLGKSRLIAYGRVETQEELEELRKGYNVPLANAMLDSGYRASDVYRWCNKTGWKPFQGTNTDLFTVTAVDPQTRRAEVVRRLWHKSAVDPAFGTHREKRQKNLRPARSISLYRFASETTKDLLAEFMMGLVGEWTIPARVGRDYLAQITAERRVAITDTKNRTRYEWRQVRRANHLLDCELMIMVAAVITKLVQSGVVRVPAAAITPA
jgi:phage terminase large subunit GpA-like protein